MAQPTMDEILEYGLISEFSYLTLESQYFQKVTTGDLNQYTTENIKNYLHATEQQIEFALDNQNIIIPKNQQSFLEEKVTGTFLSKWLYCKRKY